MNKPLVVVTATSDELAAAMRKMQNDPNLLSNKMKFATVQLNKFGLDSLLQGYEDPKYIHYSFEDVVVNGKKIKEFEHVPVRILRSVGGRKGTKYKAGTELTAQYFPRNSKNSPVEWAICHGIQVLLDDAKEGVDFEFV